jgi:peptidyl-prolyl cis-trans isomerase D
LVKSSYGFHIIQVEDKQEAHVKPFNEVKDQIAQQLAQDKAAAAADALAAKVQNEARTRDIDKAAADNHLQVYHSEWFTQTDTLPGIGSAPEFTQAAFSAPVKGAPQSVRTPQGYAVLVVTEDQKAQTPTFEQWRTHVEEDFKQQRASQMLPQKTQELADRAHAAHDLKKAAKELGATVKTSDLVTADSQVPEIGSMSGPASVAFDMKPGEISNAIQTGGSGVVFAVVDKQQPSADELAKNKEQVREKLLQQKREERLQMFVSDVRDRMQKDGKIRINNDEWNRLTGGQKIPLAS